MYLNNRFLNLSLVNRYYENLGKAKKILDLGCGNGCIGRLKPDTDIEVFGLDIDTRALSEASKYEIVQLLDLEKGPLPFEADYFDGVFAIDILEHLLFPLRVMTEINRVLKPGGVIIANVPMAKPNIVWDDYTHIRGFTKNSVNLLFNNSGFDVVYIKNMGSIPLAGKLRLINVIPIILTIPPIRNIFGKSLEIKARKVEKNLS